MSRQDLINTFLENAGWNNAQILPLAGDASFRRYDRIKCGKNIAVLMDAPPEFEDTRPFVAIADFMKSINLNAPEILAKDFDNGFLLLEDLGDNLFKRVLEENADNELSLYQNAVGELVKLNDCSIQVSLPYGSGEYSLPKYNMDLLLSELTLFTDWYYPALNGNRLSFDKRNEFLGLWRKVLVNVSDAEECLVLRDYHAENLLDLGKGNVGQLDFQDAVIGHSAYDLVSLLQDARRDVDPVVEDKMIRYFAKSLKRDEGVFREHYAILGAQRNIKIIGIFARLFLRDGKDNYLKLEPRVWRLVERCLEHPVLNEIKAWFDSETPDKRHKALNAMPLKPDHAMVLAAGLGTRMRPLTDHKPKPLIEIAGKAMLGHTLDALAAAGIKNAVVNKHYHGDQIDTYIQNRKDWRPRVHISDESDELLDSGGGVKNALAYLGDDPFVILNSDMIWQNGDQNALARLSTMWSDDMDILMLLVRRDQAHGHDGNGDFHMKNDGCLSWRGDAEFADYLYGGVLIVRPECFENTPDGAFSLRHLFNEAVKEKRLFGLIHDGSWYHVGTPDAIEKTEKHLKGE